MKNSVFIGLWVLLAFCGSLSAATVVHWTFDDADLGAANGVALPDSDGMTVWRQAATDHSGNGNHLTTWDYDWAGFVWTSDSIKGDLAMVSTGGCCPASMTWSDQSNPTGTDAETISPAQWTVEVIFKCDDPTTYRTIVGRDGMQIDSSNSALAPFYLSERAGGVIGVQFVDKAGNSHSAFSEAETIVDGTWYHIAGVSDGETLMVYLKDLDADTDYDIVATADLSGSSNSSLATGNSSGDGWTSGTWTVARGLYNGGHTDRFFGAIDEVAISTNALGEGSFVCFNNSAATNPDPADESATLVISELNWDPPTESEGTLSYDVYFDTTEPNPSQAHYGLSYLGTTSGTDMACSTSVDTTYYWLVEVTDSGTSETTIGTPWSFTVYNPPSAPTGLVATGENRRVWLDWDDNSEPEVTGYNIKRSTSGARYATIATHVADSAYGDNTVTNGETYFYKVSAVIGDTIESSNSAEVSATPKNDGSLSRVMENLDRGLVAVRRSDGKIFLSWRMLGTEPNTVSYNIYDASKTDRGGNPSKVNDDPITDSTNYLDSSGSTNSIYAITAIIDGNELELSAPVEVWNNYYHDITLASADSGYTPNDASVGDLDGDGQYEIVIKRISPDISTTSTQFSYLEAYRWDGTFMWRINLGPNLLYAPEEINPMVYDFDGDGLAEVALRTCDGTIDADGNRIGSTADYRSSVATPGGGWYMTRGPEFLSIFDGLTGVEIARADYIERDPISQWGSSGMTTGQYAHRANKCMMTPAYLDGQNPSLVICRGIYHRIKMEAWNYRNGVLSQVWTFDSDDWSGYDGQGNHNLSVADVDNDGLDEIIYASCTIDDDGTGLYSTGLGHGDALHVSDMVPERPGLEVFQCHEHSPYGTTLRDAATGEILWRKTADGDTGRCCAAHVDASYPGYQMWSSASGGTYNAADRSKISDNQPNWGNFLVWWDDDLQREILDVVGNDANPILAKWNGNGADRLISLYSVPTSYSTGSNNGSKGNPCLSGDIIGDWREEMIYRSNDNTQLRIFTTTDLTDHRMYTLMHDSQYRVAIAWQCNMYNQPPHPSFYIGADMNEPPTPDIVLAGTE